MSGPLPIVAFEGVSLWVDGHQFLDAADLVVEPGETLVVAGLPGCGKSFVLRLILGLPGRGVGDVLRLDGTVRLDGVPLARMPAAALQRWRFQVGSVLRGGGLIENMDIRGNVALPLEYHCRGSLDAAAIRARGARVLADFGLAELDVAGRRPVSLTREQRLYVALARALVVEPRLLLMDDPAGRLSPIRARRLNGFCFGYVPALAPPSPARPPLARVVTTTDMGRYLEHGTRFVLLDEGRLRVIGDREAVLASDDTRVREVLGTGSEADPLPELEVLGVAGSPWREAR